MTTSTNEPAAFRLVAQYLKQLHHSVPPFHSSRHIKSVYVHTASQPIGRYSSLFICVWLHYVISQRILFFTRHIREVTLLQASESNIPKISHTERYSMSNLTLEYSLHNTYVRLRCAVHKKQNS